MIARVLLAALVLFAGPAHAANVYVRAGATGSNNGTDWTNAYTALPSFTRGNTYYVATGTYSTGTTLNTAASGTTVIEIKGATIADHGTSTGWDNAYSVCSGEGGTRADFSGGWTISTNYWTVDGSCGNGSLNGGTTTGYGFRSRSASDGNGAVGFYFPNDVSGITISHYEVDGIDCCSMAIDAAGKDAFLCNGGCNVSGTINRVYAHDVGRTIFLLGGNLTVQYSYFARNRSTAPQHAEGWASRGGTHIVRWNIFEDIRGTGQVVQLYGTGTNHEIYGNVFRVVEGPCSSCSDSAWPIIDNTSQGTISGLKFYNNTIYGMTGNPGVGNINSSSGYDVRNNLWFNNSYGASISGAANYTYVWGTYWYGGASGSNSDWRCVQNGGGDPSGNCAGNNTVVAPSAATTFVSAPGNLKLTSNAIAVPAGGTKSMTGENLGAPYNTDMTGATRTNWTIGAYEYPGGTTTLPGPGNPRWRPAWNEWLDFYRFAAWR